MSGHDKPLASSQVGASHLDVVPVGPAEAAVLAPIHAAAFADAWTVSALSRLLRADAARAFGAFAGYDRQPLGFVLAFVAADEAEILSLAVVPAARRAGTGARLLRTLIQQLAEEGIAKLFLEVAADNTPALGLYRRLGFVETGRRTGYYARGDAAAVDALTLALTIGPATDGDRFPGLRIA